MTDTELIIAVAERRPLVIKTPLDPEICEVYADDYIQRTDKSGKTYLCGIFRGNHTINAVESKYLHFLEEKS